MDRRDTSFLGTADDVTDDEVIFAIKSVPCHYEVSMHYTANISDEGVIEILFDENHAITVNGVTPRKPQPKLPQDYPAFFPQKAEAMDRVKLLGFAKSISDRYGIYDVFITDEAWRWWFQCYELSRAKWKADEIKEKAKTDEIKTKE